MALFTHQYSTNAPAEINPADQYFEAVKVCRNYVASQDKYNGTVYSEEYRQMERDGFKFLGHVWIPGKQPRDVVMVKPAQVAVDANAQCYGRKFAAFDLNRVDELFRVLFSYDWGNGFSPKVIAGNCSVKEMILHLVSIAAPEDNAAICEYFKQREATK